MLPVPGPAAKLRGTQKRTQKKLLFMGKPTLWLEHESSLFCCGSNSCLFSHLYVLSFPFSPFLSLHLFLAPGGAAGCFYHAPVFCSLADRLLNGGGSVPIGRPLSVKARQTNTHSCDVRNRSCSASGGSARR